jgi:hypothetical protein
LAQLFTRYGDFNVFKDSKSSFYIEIFYLEPTVIKSQSINEFIEVVNQQKEELGIITIVPYKDAVKFKAHNRID